MSVKVKICGIRIPEQACEIARLGADYIGCIIEFPKSPRSVNIEQAGKIREAVETMCYFGVNPPARRGAIESQSDTRTSGDPIGRSAPSRMTTWVVGVVVDLPFDRLSRLIEETGIRIWQLHGDEDVEYVNKVKQMGVEVWKVMGAGLRHFLVAELGSASGRTVPMKPLIPEGLAPSGLPQTGVEKMSKPTGVVWKIDKIVVDAANPMHGAGGSGRLSDWDRAYRLVVEGYSVVLSGGLHPENIHDAIRNVRPDVVDVSSGVEVKPGVKDMKKVKMLIKKVSSQRVDTV